jgi:GMP synthase (glutamine-hydrolysing)
MRFHYLQHVPFEGLANIEGWIKERSHSISKTLLFNEEKLPRIDDFDWLIITGGPMGVYEEDKYPWLSQEKRFIKEAIYHQKVVLGICLGAQLIAEALGSKVYKNKYKEIGWFPVSLTNQARESSIFSRLPDNFTAFHWHGDTFDLPPGAIRVAESKGCLNQAFEYHKRVIGLQFHLEPSVKSIQQLIKNCSSDIVEGRYVQTPEKMLLQTDYLKKAKRLMGLLLDEIERGFSKDLS